MNSLNTLTQITESLKTNENVLVMFSAKWCHACKKMKRKIETLVDIYSNVSFNYVDITLFENEDEVVEKYNIRKIPTFVFYKNEEEYIRVEGSKNREDILKTLEELNKETTEIKLEG